MPRRMLRIFGDGKSGGLTLDNMNKITNLAHFNTDVFKFAPVTVRDTSLSVGFYIIFKKIWNL